MEPIVFQFSTLVLAIPFGIAAIAIIASGGFFAAGKKGPAAGLGFVALIAGLIFGPSMLKDRVIVTDKKIEQQTGFFFAQTVKGFEFSDVSFVRITRKPTGPKNRMAMVWEIHKSNGSTQDIDPGDLWESNSDEIAKVLQDRGVEFR